MMKHYALKSTIAYCEIADQILVLDTACDRYFALPLALRAPFRAVAKGENISADAAGALEGAQVIERASGEGLTVRTMLPSIRHAISARDKTQWTVIDVVRGLHLRHQVKAKLRRTGVHGLFQNLAARTRNLPAFEPANARAAHIIKAFEIGELIVSPAEQCLIRSIALVQMLAANGFGAHVVLGVRLEPFHAHSWAQVGDLLLNDTLEEVAKFTPILVI